MLVLRAEAEQDIKAAYEWYEKQSPNLGRAFLGEIEKQLVKIEENPELYAKAYKNIRRALCKRFPYSIYFVELAGKVVVIGVLHQRRSPAVWQSRK
ncbi:MAG: type II toxin-antitoxin system RelE/ParE family toxin [Gammaproteobacteria bacterium]